MDHDQVVEISGFQFQKTGDNRKPKADRQQFPASAGLQSQRGRNIDSWYVLSKAPVWHPTWINWQGSALAREKLAVVRVKPR
jgi:hypothetical protein